MRMLSKYIFLAKKLLSNMLQKKKKLKTIMFRTLYSVNYPYFNNYF